jgi:hypothetical protein
VYLEAASDEIISASLDFSIDARRYLEVTNTRDLKIFGGRWKVEDKAVKGFNFEESVWEAINGLLHARHLEVMFAPAGNGQFERMGDVGVVALEIESDKRSRYHVEPFGLCNALLSRKSSV